MGFCSCQLTWVLLKLWHWILHLACSNEFHFQLFLFFFFFFAETLCGGDCIYYESILWTGCGVSVILWECIFSFSVSKLESILTGIMYTELIDNLHFLMLTMYPGGDGLNTIPHDAWDTQNWLQLHPTNFQVVHWLLYFPDFKLHWTYLGCVLDLAKFLAATILLSSDTGHAKLDNSH